MNQSASRSFGKRLRRAQVAALALAALWATSIPQTAEAALPGSAGNTIVRNTITINYKDAQGAAQAAVSVPPWKAMGGAMKRSVRTAWA